MSVDQIPIGPGPGLTKPADPRSGQKTQFALFTDDWLQLQSYIGAAVDLPITKGDFEAKYGSFGSMTVINDCIAAMKNVQNASTEFGNPKSLRAALIKNPNLLATKVPPTEIYTHTVWMGQLVHKTAATIASGYESVLEGLTGLPNDEQVANLKAYLFDPTMGPIPLAGTMNKEIGDLIKKLGTFEKKMNEYNAKMQAFTREGSTMIKDVDVKIGSLGQQIQDLSKTRDEAWQAWKNFTIAAITASVGCALIGAVLAPFTFGVSALVGGAAAIATAIGLGIKAAQNRAKYNEYCKLVENAEADLRKKQRLRADLTDFNGAMGLVGPAMAGFLKSLQTVQGVWVQMGTDMQFINDSLTPSNVGNLAFLVRTKSKMAVDAWKSVDDSAKQFTVQSLVDYTSIAFGDKMPEKAAA
jgi:hypothetical protein